MDFDIRDSHFRSFLDLIRILKSEIKISKKKKQINKTPEKETALKQFIASISHPHGTQSRTQTHTIGHDVKNTKTQNNQTAREFKKNYYKK